MLFVHYCVFLFAYCAVVMAGYFDAIKVCCKATLLASAALLKLYVPPGWCQMSNRAGITDIPKQDMKLDNVYL